LEGQLLAGGFWDGDRKQARIGLTVRPTPGLRIETNWERNEVDLPRGDFHTNLLRLGGGWDVSPWVSMIGNVQYDNVSEILGLFARARWIVRPGNDIYLVYTHNWQNFGEGLMDQDLVTLSRGGSMKVNYSYRF
jgi:hypothetical protein